MTQGFDELVVGGVLVAPFVTYAVASALILAALVPMLRSASLERLGSMAPVTLLCVYLVTFALLIVFL